ncbi:hypothetical protein B484DRAFT_435798, partial [Ochromonadaceae sp. CCMP2298]
YDVGHVVNPLRHLRPLVKVNDDIAAVQTAPEVVEACRVFASDEYLCHIGEVLAPLEALQSQGTPGSQGGTSEARRSEAFLACAVLLKALWGQEGGGDGVETRAQAGRALRTLSVLHPSPTTVSNVYTTAQVRLLEAQQAASLSEAHVNRDCFLEYLGFLRDRASEAVLAGGSPVGGAGFAVCGACVELVAEVLEALLGEEKEEGERMVYGSVPATAVAVVVGGGGTALPQALP